MKISENFDRWMFDYKEGNLSASEMDAFENFLAQHPEFEIDADAWDQAFVSSETYVYPNAHKLEKRKKAAGWYYWGAAASLLLLLTSSALFVFYNDNNELQNPISFKNKSFYGYNNEFNRLNISLGNKGDENFTALISSNSKNSVSNSPSITSNASLGLNQNNSTTLMHNQQTQILWAQNNSSSVVELTNEVNSVNGTLSLDLMKGEADKLNGNDYSGKYQSNPEIRNLGFDVSKKASNKYTSNSSKFRKFYKKVEKMLSYPVGLTNLRDHELGLPQNSVLAFNSSFAGGMLKPRFEMNYRNQWLGSELNSQELNISFDNYVYNMRGGVGLLINAQDYGYGKFGDYNVSLLYSPKIVIRKSIVFEPSVKLTMGSLIANGNKLTPNSAFEMDRGRTIHTIGENQMSGVSNIWYKDYGLGAMINTKWFYAGFNADNLGRHYENVYGNDLSSPAKTPVKMTAVIGTDYLSSTKTMTYSPFIAYQQFGEKPEFWGGMNYKVNWFTVGGAVSSNKEFTASIGMKFETFKLVYQYDMTESVLTQERMGSHTISMRFNAKRKNQRLTH